MNKVVLSGRFTRDPELRHTPQGTPVATFSLAVDKPISRETAERNGERTADFFECECWERTADFVAKYFRKGSRVVVFGRLKQDSWQDKETGKNRSTVRVVVNEAEFADSKQQQEGGYQPGGYQPGGYQPAPYQPGGWQPPAESQYRPQPSYSPPPQDSGFKELGEELDGDLPF